MRALLALVSLLSMAQIAGPAHAAPLYGETYLVSTSHEDGPFGDDSTFAAVSKDGLRAFWTTPESLLSADSNNGNVDIYERIDTHTTRLVTPGGTFDATFLAISEDGSKVFFSTRESITADGDSEVDIYRRNLDHQPPTTTNMTPGTSAPVRFTGSNLVGDRVFFETTERLTGNDTDNETDVYMSQSGSISRISVGSNGGNDPCHANYSGSTPDGRHVFFSTRESLEPNDDYYNPAIACHATFSDVGSPDIHHWSGGSVTNITPTGACPTGAGAGCQADRFAWTSLDGSRVIFNSPNLHNLPDQRDGGCLDDVYQTVGGAVTKLSPSPWDSTPDYCSTGKGYYPAVFAGASADARKVYWYTREPGIAGDGDAHRDIFLTTNAGAPTLRSPNTPSADVNFAWTTPDGDTMFFGSIDPVVNDSDSFGDVFQNTGGAITKISTGPLGGNGPFSSGFAGATDDASHVFFSTGEPLTSDDRDASGTDVYLRHEGTTELISTGPLAGTSNFTATYNAISEDAERVFFSTSERLVAEDTDQRVDVYMRWKGGAPSVRIDEFARAPDAFVELLKMGQGQDEFPAENGPYKLVAYDAGGNKVGQHVISPALLRGQARPLFSDTLANADEPLQISLPPAGQLCYTQGVGEVRISCVAWGCLATELDPTVIHVAAPGSGVSQQRQPSAPNVFHLAAPTPKNVNISGTTAPACPSNPAPRDGGDGPGDLSGDTGTADTTAPKGRVIKLGKPKPGKLIRIKVVSNEAGTVTATGTQIAKTAKQKTKKKPKDVKATLQTVRAHVRAGKTITLTLKPKNKQAQQISRAVKTGAKASATIVVVFRDQSGNSSRNTLSFRLK